MIIAWGAQQGCADDDESCGDWVDRLNHFSEKQKDKFEIFKISARLWPQVVLIPKGTVPEHSSLLMSKNLPSYFYKGAITESEVYQSVLNAWLKSPDKKTESFLPAKINAELCR